MKEKSKNEYMTVRDPGEEIRGMLDEIRILEAEGKRIPADRTATLKSILIKTISELRKKK